MRLILHPGAPGSDGALDITAHVREAIQRSRVTDGLASLHAASETTALLLRDERDDGFDEAIVAALQELMPGARDPQRSMQVRLKAALLGRCVTVPVVTGQLGPGGRSRVLMIDFGGSGDGIDVTCTIIADTGIPQNVP